MTTGSGAGYFGKIPGRGDFIAAGLPSSFVEPLDIWLRSALARARGRVGETWQEVFLSSPVWRFILAPGVCGPHAYAGVIASSADSIGRLFPLTLAAPIPGDGDLSILIAGWAAGFERMIDLALMMIQSGGELDQVNASLGQLTGDIPIPILPPMAAAESVLTPGDAVRIAAVPPGTTLTKACGPVLGYASPQWSLMWRIGWGLPSAAIIGCSLPDTRRNLTPWEEPNAA